MASKVRIKGLVKAKREVQALIGTGGPFSRERIREIATETVQRVTDICLEEKISPEDLPAPSYSAYIFLRAIAQGREAFMAEGRARVAAMNVVTAPRFSKQALQDKARELGRLMWKRRAEFLRDRSLLGDLSRRIKQLLQELMGETKSIEHISPGAAPLGYWLQFLLANDHLKRSLKALDRAERAAVEVLPKGTTLPELIWMPPIEESVLLVPGPPAALLISAEFFNASKTNWKHVISYALDPDKIGASLEVSDFLQSEACDQYRRRFSAPGAAQPVEASIVPDPLKDERIPDPPEPVADGRFQAKLTERALQRLRDARPLPRQTLVGGILRMPMWYFEDDVHLRMHQVFFTDDRGRGLYPGATGSGETLGADQIICALGDVATGVDSLPTGRPGRIVLNNERAVELLSRSLAGHGVEVVYDPKPPVLANILEFFQEEDRKRSGNPKVPRLLEPKGMTLDRLRSFAEAAHDFHAAGPWRHLSDEDVIEVSPDPLGFKYLRVLGNAAIEQGLVWSTYEDLDTKQDYLILNFVSAPEAIPMDVDLFDEENLPVHDGRYPMLVRVDGRRMRRLAPANLAIVEGTMRALIASTPEEMDQVEWRKTVATVDGPITFTFQLKTLQNAGDFEDHGGRAAGQAEINSQFRAVQRLIDSGASPDELNSILAKADGDLNSVAPPKSLKERAADLADEAFSAPGRRKLQMAREALQLDPNCVTAHSIFGQFLVDVDPQAALPHFETAMRLARAEIRNEDFQEFKGSLWQCFPARGFMMAKYDIANCLMKLDRHEEARRHLDELGELSTHDNLGSRYDLVTCLFKLDDRKAIEKLLKVHDEDISGIFDWARCLLSFRQEGDSKTTAAALRNAMESNHHVRKILLNIQPSPRTPGRWSPGEASEAEMIASHLKAPWQETKGALSWLKSQ